MVWGQPAFARMSPTVRVDLVGAYFDCCAVGDGTFMRHASLYFFSAFASTLDVVVLAVAAFSPDRAALIWRGQMTWN